MQLWCGSSWCSSSLRHDDLFLLEFFLFLLSDGTYWMNKFLIQLGYTKKQEERHFRGVITLEVWLICSSQVMSSILIPTPYSQQKGKIGTKIEMFQVLYVMFLWFWCLLLKHLLGLGALAFIELFGECILWMQLISCFEGPKYSKVLKSYAISCFKTGGWNCQSRSIWLATYLVVAPNTILKHHTGRTLNCFHILLEPQSMKAVAFRECTPN